MNVADIGNLYYGEKSTASLEDLAARGRVPLGATVSDPLTALSPFTKALDAAVADQSRRPVGAAANSGPADVEHVSKKRASVDRSSPLFKQCQELESFIIKNMLKSMRDTVQKSDLTGGGFAGQMYEDMLYDKYSESMAANAGFGLADQVYLELSGQRGRT